MPRPRSTEQDEIDDIRFPWIELGELREGLLSGKDVPGPRLSSRNANRCHGRVSGACVHVRRARDASAARQWLENAPDPATTYVGVHKPHESFVNQRGR